MKLAGHDLRRRALAVTGGAAFARATAATDAGQRQRQDHSRAVRLAITPHRHPWLFPRAFRAGVFILTPLLGSLTSLLPKLGG